MAMATMERMPRNKEASNDEGGICGNTIYLIYFGKGGYSNV